MASFPINQFLILPLICFTVSLYISIIIKPPLQPEESTTMVSEKFGVRIENNPPQSKLIELGVSNWPKYEAAPSKIPWTFSGKETMYLLKGKVKVTVEGFDESFEIGAGDFVEFPKGMTITWDVIETVNKHYSVEK